MYVKAVEVFLDSAEWTRVPEHAPAVATLRSLAEALDNAPAPVPAVVAQFGLTYRSLLKAKPPVTEEGDELTKALRDAAL